MSVNPVRKDRHESNARHHRPHPRLLGDAPQLGALDRPLRGAAASACSRPAYPGFEVEVEALNADTDADRGADRAADHRAPRGRRRRARLAADPHRPLGRRRVHADPARPRLRRGGRGDQLGADRGRQASCRSRRSRRRSRCSRTPPTGTRRSASRSSSGTTRSPTRSARRSPARSTSATTSRPPGAIFWGSALANIHPGHDDNHVDYTNDDRAPLLFISGSEDHLMPPKIQQSNAKHYKSDTRHRGQGVRGPAPAAGRAGLGGGRRLRARLGARARRAAEPRVNDVRLTHIGGPTVADRGRRLAAADRPDVRRPRPEVPLRLGRVVAQARRAGDRRRRPRPDRRGPAHRTTTTATTSTPPGRALLPSAGVVVTTASGAAAARRAPRAGSSRGRRRGSRRRAGRRSRSPRRRAATVRRTPTRSSATSSASRCAGRARSTACCGSPATPCSTTACARSPSG